MPSSLLKFELNVVLSTFYNVILRLSLFVKLTANDQWQSWNNPSSLVSESGEELILEAALAQAEVAASTAANSLQLGEEVHLGWELPACSKVPVTIL